MGRKTFFVSLVIDTWLNEAEIQPNNYSDFNPAVLSPLLSHPWSADAGLDEQFFETRTITGRAVFRRDRLEVLKRVPDDYRTWLFHPLLGGFQRQSVDVTQQDDGVTFDYAIVDRQLYVSHAFKDVADIDIQVQTSYEDPSGPDALADVAAMGAEQIVASKFDIGTDKGRRRRNVARAGKVFTSLIGAGARKLSFRTFGIEITIRGNPRATRESLLNAGFAIEDYLKVKLHDFIDPSLQQEVIASLTEPLVIIRSKRIAGPLSGFGKDDAFKRIQRVNDMTLGGRFNFPATSSASVYPRDGLNKGSRGTSGEAVMAAILHDTGTAHVRPEDQRRNFQQTTP